MIVPSYSEDAHSGIYPDWRVLVDHYYGCCEPSRSILIEHSRAVALLALAINRRCALGLDPKMVEYAAMVHDIGIFGTWAPGIGCSGTEPYITHGIIGGDLLRSEGVPEWAARVAERHTGAGLTADDILSQALPLPTDRILMPDTLLEKLICYADKFFSKRPGQLSQPKTIDRVRAEMAGHGSGSATRFDALAKLFG